MSKHKDNNKAQSIDSKTDKNQEEQKPSSKKERFKFDEKDMYKITYDF